jgi:hypothetical protein
MPFIKKFSNSGDTVSVRVPQVYAELVKDLMVILDKNFDVEKGTHLLRKFIHNLT